MDYAEKDDFRTFLGLVGVVLIGFVFIMASWIWMGVAIYLGGLLLVLLDHERRAQSKWGSAKNMAHPRDM